MSAHLDPAVLRPAPSTRVPGAPLWRALPATAVYPLAGRLAAWLAFGAALLAAAALATATWVSPVQGAAWPGDLVHQPASWAALCAYFVMAACAALTLAGQGWLAPIAMRGLAPVGGVLTLLALFAGTQSERGAGSDAQFTSELALLVMYAAFLLLRSTLRDAGRADRAGAALVLVGAFNLPMIYWSVHWWDMLPRAAAIGAAASPAAQHNMLAGVLLMTLAFCACAIAAALGRVRRLMLHDASCNPAGCPGNHHDR